MLMALMIIFFGVIVIAGFMFMLGGFASGVGQVIAAKKSGIPRRPVIPPGVQKWAAKQARMNQEPVVNVTVQMPPAKETPEEKEAREKAKARKRYLDSLVDR